MYELYGHPDSVVKFDEKYITEKFVYPQQYYRRKATVKKNIYY